MKKYSIVLCLAVFLFFCAFSSFRLYQPSASSKQVKVTAPNVAIVVSTPEKIVFQTTIVASTVFEALEKGSEMHAIFLKTKQFDFGIFVESIGDKKSTKEFAWLYFVNGKAGTVAADKYELHDGDHVEWKYIKPTF